MKKTIGKIFALFLFFNIYGINYKTLESTKLYESDGTFNYYARDIDKNETVKISKAQIYYGVSDWKYSVEILYHDTHYFTNVENLVPESTQNILSDNISLIHSEDAEWLSSYYFDMLKERNRDVVKSKQQNGFREYQDRKTEFDYEWYYTLSFLRPTYFFNSVVTISLLFDNCSFLVKNISKEKSDYLIEAEVYDWFMPDATNSYSTGDYVLLAVLLVSLGGASAGDFEEYFEGKHWVREYYNEAISRSKVLDMTYNQLHENDGGVKGGSYSCLRFISQKEDEKNYYKTNDDWKNHRLNPLTGERA